jgi:hypothetical protein
MVDETFGILKNVLGIENIRGQGSKHVKGWHRYAKHGEICWHPRRY